MDSRCNTGVKDMVKIVATGMWISEKVRVKSPIVNFYTKPNACE